MVKITINVCSVQKLLLYFFEKKFSQTGNLLFDSFQLLLVRDSCKNEIIGSVNGCGLGKDFNSQQWQHWQRFRLNQSDFYVSFGIIKYEIVV